jgi:excisionase family DNA binding protein
MDLYNVQEAAKKLKMDTETIRRYLRRGELKGAKLGNKWRIKKVELENFFNEREGLN